MKKIIVILLTTFLLSLINETNVCAEGEETAFAGRRTESYTIDVSDITNFINGGRSNFDFVLRNSRPEWLNYEIKTQDRNVILTIYFDFISYDDYYSKICELTLTSPSIVWLSQTGERYMEDINAMDLITFFEYGLTEAECLREKKMTELVEVTENILTLNGKDYSSDSSIDIGAENTDVIPLDTLYISTMCTEEGKITRTVTAGIYSEYADSETVTTLYNQFKRLGLHVTLDESTNPITVSTEFTTGGMQTTNTLTMLLLNVPISYTETLSVADDTSIGMECMEFFDTEQLLRNEDSSFTYEYQYPDTYQNIQYGNNPDNMIDSTNNNVLSYNEPTVYYYYEMDYCFQGAEIITDMSSVLGQTTRTIRLSMQKEIADAFYPVIKEKLEERLMDGVTLNIYDEGNIRYYEMIFSAWFQKDIDQFTESMLNCTVTRKNKISWLPFGKSTIEEQYSLKNIIPEMTSPRNIEISYCFPSYAKVTLNDGIQATYENQIYIQKSGAECNVLFILKSVSLVRNIVFLFIVLLALTVVVFIIRKTIKMVKNKRIS